MKFWKFSTTAVAALLASVSMVSAGGPADGQAAADPDSAVVKLTEKEFKGFLEENPLVLTEFFAPWCGYCKILGPEFSKAADILNESHPNIKLAQIDCTEQEDLCHKHEIRGYPTMKVMRGPFQQPDDYDGPRDADGIVNYMVKQSLPPVQLVEDADAFVAASKAENQPFIVQVFPSKLQKKFSSHNETFGELANEKRKSMSFFSIEDDAQIAKLDKAVSAKLSGLKEPAYLVIHPNELDDVRVFSGEVNKSSLEEFSVNAKVPYFGDINRDTYLTYMTSSLPLGYYFYSHIDERAAVDKFFTELGKKYAGKINFVGLDASQYGRHAEILNMNPEIVPLFAIQDNSNSRKYGIDQTENPNPSTDDIKKFVEDFLAGKVEPIIKSEPLPSEEEVASQAVVKLVSHNYEDILKDNSKDVFVKYYAPWCGHCKKLAPIWEELADIYGSKNEDSDVVIAHIDHTLNDVDTPIPIEGYPTLLFYPANGEVDPKTGLREHRLYTDGRDLESLIAYIKKNGLGVDGEKLRAEKQIVEDDGEEEEVVEEAAEEAAEHDEL
ncbi:protein disulfide-isomerase domain [Candidozyma pseudohaemuli]|uniref:protein disulfide-isomerase n=1 Tax=Candidozyma pseudohaemuli TaxID=418784 RepID=A0A2P7YYV8_9ASCO|nr:protein disulfide-isomerase domain [[Candida] pseudohaemulonii]PSK41153.1 protein disulfide-isomerase domain [[Candida] pseudohaemulonii]